MSPLCGTTCVLRPWWHFGILMHLRWTESKAFLEGWGKYEGNQAQFKHIREQEGASEWEGFQPNPALSLFDAAQFEADVWELRHKAIRHSEAVLELRVLAQATGEACCAAAGFDMILRAGGTLTSKGGQYAKSSHRLLPPILDHSVHLSTSQYWADTSTIWVPYEYDESWDDLRCLDVLSLVFSFIVSALRRCFASSKARMASSSKPQSGARIYPNLGYVWYRCSVHRNDAEMMREWWA